MAKGIIYITSTVVDGLIKIGKCQSDQYENRMRNLEHNGYCNVAGLKRQFAIEVDDYDEKEVLIHSIFSKSRLADTELFSLDLDLAIQLLSAFDGTVVYPEQSKEEIFGDATDALVDKETALNKNRHGFRDLEFTSSTTGRRYKGTTADDGTLKIIDLTTGMEVPNHSDPSKREIVGQAVLDLGGKINPNNNTLYGRYHQLMKLIK